MSRPDGAAVGRLVPIGPWALEDETLIAQFARWRKMFMRFYQSQFKASEDRTRWYLENLSIGQPDRIFFAIIDTQIGLVGHIGLSNVNAESAELDNIIRGVSGGEAQLMRLSQGALLHWAFDSLGVQKIVAHVFSFNQLAHKLHASFGFVKETSYPLVKSKDGDEVSHDRTDYANANVAYKLDFITLERTAFRRP